MAKPTYSELLRDPRWQRRRLEILGRDNWTCQYCLSTDDNLQVHHQFYRYGAMPWEYEDSSLTTLCEYCHDTEEEIIKVTTPRAAIYEGLRRIGCTASRMAELVYRIREAPSNPVYSGRLWVLLMSVFTDPDALDAALRGVVEYMDKNPERTKKIRRMRFHDVCDGKAYIKSPNSEELVEA